MYTIKLDQFEGPLDLLLELIEGQKLEVTEISLAQVTNQFLDYLKNNDNSITTNYLANFLVVASKLILIKSRALLPFLELTKEEEEDIGDLEKQLKEYQQFRQAAQVLKEMLDQHNVCFSREHKEVLVGLFYPPRNINGDNLAEIFQRILNDVPVVVELPKDILKSRVSIEDKIRYITEVIKKRVEISFHSLTDGNLGREHLVANFLAVLELARQKLIAIEQKQMFGEIKLLKLET